MSAKRYTEEFKIEAVKQVVERNYKISNRPSLPTIFVNLNAGNLNTLTVFTEI